MGKNIQCLRAFKKRNGVVNKKNILIYEIKTH
jgi:hypothetical protein